MYFLLLIVDGGDQGFLFSYLEATGKMYTQLPDMFNCMRYNIDASVEFLITEGACCILHYVGPKPYDEIFKKPCTPTCGDRNHNNAHYTVYHSELLWRLWWEHYMEFQEYFLKHNSTINDPK